MEDSIRPTTRFPLFARMLKSQSSPASKLGLYPPKESSALRRKHLGASISESPWLVFLSIALQVAQKPCPIETSGITKASCSSSPAMQSSRTPEDITMSESTKRTAFDEQCSKPIFLAMLRFASAWITLAPLFIPISGVPSKLNRSTTIISRGAKD